MRKFLLAFVSLSVCVPCHHLNIICIRIEERERKLSYSDSDHIHTVIDNLVVKLDRWLDRQPPTNTQRTDKSHEFI